MPSPPATRELVRAAAVLLAASAPAWAGAGQSGTAAGVTRILLPIGGLIILTILGGLGVMAVRRRMLAKDSPASDQGGLLDELRRMRSSGQISDEEFDAARRTIAARLTGKPSVPRRPPDSGAT